MATNAVAATIAQARKLAANPATNVPCSLASIATQAGYPGSSASPVRALYRRNGHGARANGQGRYALNTPAQWVVGLTTTHTALGPNATKQQQAAGRSATVRNIALGKASKAGAKRAKRAAKQGKATPPVQPAPAPTVPTPQPTTQPTPAPAA